MKIRVCILLDEKINQKFKNKYPQLMSRYIEQCLIDGLSDKKLVYNKIDTENKKKNIFNFMGKK